MFLKLIQKYTFLLILSAIFALAWFIQSTILLNMDVSWFLEAARRLLSGGSYSKDFFENNPPWILYFSIPPVLLGKFFSISVVLAMRIYVFLLSVVSLSIDYYFLKKIFTKEDFYIAKILLFILAVLFLILPIADFGQREHLLFIFMTPYLFLMTLRLQQQQINRYLAITVGLLAGSVLMFKPYFFSVLFFLEIYYLLTYFHSSSRGLSTGSKEQKNWIPRPSRGTTGKWSRPELLAIATLLILYAIIITLRHVDYLKKVMPFAAHWCYLGTRNSWSIVIGGPLVKLCFLSIFFYVAIYEMDRYQQLSRVLLIAFIGFFFSYLMQQENWFYHLLPAYFSALLMFTLFFSLYITTIEKKKYISILMIFFLLLLFLFLCSYSNSIITLLEYQFLYKPLYLSVYIVGITCFVLYLMSARVQFNYLFYYSSLLYCVLIMSLIYVPLHLVGSMDGVLILYFAIILIYSLLIPGSYRDKANYGIAMLIAMLIFVLPYYQILLGYSMYKNNKKYYASLIAYLDTNAANQSVYFFTTNIAHTFPVITYSKNTTSASRFSFLWALPGLVKQSLLPMNKKLAEQYNHDKQFQIDMIAQDLTVNKPKLVFIDALDRKNSLYWMKNRKGYFTFNYLSYFGNNPNFITAWKPYHYLTTISQTVSYHLNLYHYNLRLMNLNKPKDDDLELNTLYLYVNPQQNIEVAFLDDREEVKRIEVIVANGFDKTLIFTIKTILATPNEQLVGKNKDLFLEGLAKQTVIDPFYKFNVYARE